MQITLLSIPEKMHENTTEISTIHTRFIQVTNRTLVFTFSIELELTLDRSNLDRDLRAKFSPSSE